MRDLEQDLRRTDYTLPEGAPVPTLLFADDTLLLAANATDTTTLLNLVIEHSEPYNLGLNQNKCQLLVTNDQGGRSFFPDGTELTKQETIKYLGTDFNNTLNVGVIIRRLGREREWRGGWGKNI